MARQRRQRGPTLFDVGRDEMLDQPNVMNFARDENRAMFLAGMISAWTLGTEKPTPAQREQFIDIARDALSQADEVRRSQ